MLSPPPPPKKTKTMLIFFILIFKCGELKKPWTQLNPQWKINFVMPYFWEISQIMAHYGRYQNRSPWRMLKMASFEFHHILWLDLICYKTRNIGTNFVASENRWPILLLLQFLLLLWPPSQFQPSVHFPLLFTMLQRIHILQEQLSRKNRSESS